MTERARYMGYWSSMSSRSLNIGQGCFFFAWIWTETEPRSIKLGEKEQSQYLVILTKQAQSIKDLSYCIWLSGKIFLAGHNGQALRSKQESSIFPTQAENNIVGFGSCCQLTELTIHKEKSPAPDQVNYICRSVRVNDRKPDILFMLCV